VIDNSFKGRLVNYGFIEEILTEPNDGKIEKPGEHGAKHLLKSGLLSRISSLEKFEIMAKTPFFAELAVKAKNNEQKLMAIVEKHKPDIHVIDNFVGSPTLIYSDKPWVYLFSGNPLFVLDDERTPPGASGLYSLKKLLYTFLKIRDRILELCYINITS